MNSPLETALRFAVMAIIAALLAAGAFNYVRPMLSEALSNKLNSAANVR